MTPQTRSVQCPEHGPQQETFVCQHIAQGLKKNLAQGFWIAEDPENLRPDAWCTSCNDALHKAGGEWEWTEDRGDSECKITVWRVL